MREIRTSGSVGGPAGQLAGSTRFSKGSSENKVIGGEGPLPGARNELSSAVVAFFARSSDTPPAYRAFGSHGIALKFGRTAVKERGR